MKRINVSQIIGSRNAATRADAQLVVPFFQGDTEADFTDIEYISSAFVDELIINLSPKIIDLIQNNAPHHIQKMIDAVKLSYASAR